MRGEKALERSGGTFERMHKPASIHEAGNHVGVLRVKAGCAALVWRWRLIRG